MHGTIPAQGVMTVAAAMAAYGHLLVDYTVSRLLEDRIQSTCHVCITCQIPLIADLACLDHAVCMHARHDPHHCQQLIWLSQLLVTWQGANPREGLPKIRKDWVKKREERGDKVFTQMHYARQGVVTEEMAFCAARERLEPEFVRSEVVAFPALVMT